MKLDKKMLLIRAAVFAVFVFWVVGFPRILPYTYADGQYYWTYIQDSWSLFFVVFLYPPAYLVSGALCALIRYRPMVLWVIPDLLVCLQEFYDRAEWNGGFRWHTFVLNILLHLLMWVLGVLLIHGLRWLSIRIRQRIQSVREEYRTYKQRRNGGGNRYV